MNIPFVDLKAQYASIKDEIDGAIAEVIDNTAFIGGSFAKAFEDDFARFCQTDHCVGVGNGTDALFIALKALGIGEGDEVITAANSFIATSEAITMAGAKVVFVDVNPLTYNIDTELIEAKLTPQTRAIIPVHLYGQPADMDPILAIARQYDLKVIEDAAQGHGAFYKDRKIGSIGDMACFSFYPGKNLGAYGDAGAIVTGNEELAVKARMFANHGRVEKYNHEKEGVNSRLDGIQGAVLSTKLKYLTQWTENRRRNAYRYNERLAGIEAITPPVEIDDVKAVYHLYVVRVPGERRDALQAYLKENEIATGIHYPIALPDLKAYAYIGHTAKDFPVSSRTAKEIVSLPMFPELTDDQIDYVADKMRAFFFQLNPPPTRNNRFMEPLKYAVVTPARNEAAFIEQTIQSMIAQSVPPAKWIIVSDGSTDGTDDLVKGYLDRYAWMELVRMPERRDRQFAAKVIAFRAGYERLKSIDCDVVGNLDADITFEPDYFAYLIEQFQRISKLGVAGTPFIENGNPIYDFRFTNIEHVSGACQMFRRRCFEEIGGYQPVKSGGIDWIAVTTARMRGWKTRTFTDKYCEHHRKMGTGSHSAIKSWFKHGQKDYFLGGHSLWQLFRAAYQMTKQPYFVGGALLLLGYAWAAFRRMERPVSTELMQFNRMEQMKRLKAKFGLVRPTS